MAVYARAQNAVSRSELHFIAPVGRRRTEMYRNGRRIMGRIPL